MDVLVFSIPGQPDWRWRIVDGDSKTVEDSSASLPTVAEALAEGRERRRITSNREAGIVSTMG